VRGELVLKAQEHAKALKAGEPRPFSKITFCNIGNPHELGQAPLTFFRQVFALVNYPALLDDPRVGDLFPPDAIARARRYVAAIPGGTGAYSNSQGIEAFRDAVARFIAARDGVPAHASDVFLTDGASPAVQMMIRAMLRSKSDAIMIPIPQYPLYTASIALYGGSPAGYYLQEEGGWRLDAGELERSIAAARAGGKTVRAIVVINPGNPTGNTLSEADMRAVLAFAAREKLVLLADEVYQANVWRPDRPWRSFKAVAAEMGLIDPADSTANKGVQLVSFHTISKGFTGECGRRGGYMELVGFDAGVRAELYKLASISLCSNVGGQIMMGLMVEPPVEGDASHKGYAAERDAILASLQRRAVKLVAALNTLEGVSCEEAEGALYVFPRVRLPAKAVAAAAAAGKAADTFYCLALLDATGIVVVPGSGFGQVDGTWHFRSTILPAEADMDGVIARMTAFHAAFMDKYR
jgi:alanine transaminase